jgi:molecular chaperone DnaK (HSP70)
MAVDADKAVRVGIDFGTTHTIVAVADDGNHPVLALPFEYDGETLVAEHVPTAITILGDRTWYGPAAIRGFIDHFDEGPVIVSSIKRLLAEWRQGKRVRIGPVDALVADLVTGFLADVRRAIVQALDVEDAPIEAVIAVPANASSSQRFVTLECFRRAGFRILKILDEPIASGIQFVHERYKRTDRVEADVIVYDLGGGTFDTTYLSIRRGRYDPVLSRGISRLGGDDFDEILLDLVERELDRPLDFRQRMETRQVVRGVKESIGAYTQKLHVDTPHGVVSIPIKTFQAAIEPLLDRTLDLLDQVLVETRGQNVPPDRVVLVGGGTLLGAVPKKLRERFGRAKIHQGLYPFASVAIGAAIKAGRPDLNVHDRLHNHFGVLRVREDGREYLDVIFEKGRPLPPARQMERVGRPSYDPRHNIGRFQYLECDAVDEQTGLPAGDAVFWNEIFFPYDQALNPNGGPAPPLGPDDVAPADHLGDERIEEEYYLDEYGIVTSRISRTVQDDFSGWYNLYRRLERG